MKLIHLNETGTTMSGFAYAAHAAKAFTNWGGREVVDSCRLAKLAGVPETAVIVAARCAQLQIEEVPITSLSEDLTRIRETLLEWKIAAKYSKSEGIKVYWEKGLEHEDPEIRDGFRAICGILIESAAKELGISVFELKSYHFRPTKDKSKHVTIPVLGITLEGLHEHLFRKWQRSTESNDMDAIDYIFRSLGFPIFRELPLSEQLTILISINDDQNKRLPWCKVPKDTRRYLVMKLIGQIGTNLSFKSFKQPLDGLGFNLEGLYFNYFHNPARKDQGVIDFILRDLNLRSEDERVA